MALKRTEIKRSKIERTRKKNQAKKQRRDIKRITQLARMTEYQIACAKVDERDHYCCRECGGTFGLEHHHARFRSSSGADDVENLVLLCSYHHKYSPTSPHMSAEGRKKWVDYLTELYPVYWMESRKSQEITQRHNNVIGV